MAEGDSTEVMVIIDNSGTGGLHYLLGLSDTSSWLVVSNGSGQLDQSAADTSTIWMFGAIADTGQHSIVLEVSANDPSPGKDLTEIPISFYVVAVPTYECGDANSDGVGPDIVDLIYLVFFMFQDGPPPLDMNSVDVDGNGQGPDIADLIHLVYFMFQDGPDLMCP